MTDVVENGGTGVFPRGFIDPVNNPEVPWVGPAVGDQADPVPEDRLGDEPEDVEAEDRGQQIADELANRWNRYGFAWAATIPAVRTRCTLSSWAARPRRRPPSCSPAGNSGTYRRRHTLDLHRWHPGDRRRDSGRPRPSRGLPRRTTTHASTGRAPSWSATDTAVERLPGRRPAGQALRSGG